ncbi:MAG: DsrE family protein [Candidatus Odinarchaeota archaeon]
MEKNILVLLTRPPAGHIHVVEGARIAVGLTLEGHLSQLLFTRISVFAARKDFKDRLFNNFLEELEEIYVDATALKEHGIAEEDLRAGVRVIGTAGITELVERAEFILTF